MSKAGEKRKQAPSPSLLPYDRLPHPSVRNGKAGIDDDVPTTDLPGVATSVSASASATTATAPLPVRQSDRSPIERGYYMLLKAVSDHRMWWESCKERRRERVHGLLGFIPDVVVNLISSYESRVVMCFTTHGSIIFYEPDSNNPPRLLETGLYSPELFAKETFCLLPVCIGNTKIGVPWKRCAFALEPRTLANDQYAPTLGELVVVKFPEFDASGHLVSPAVNPRDLELRNLELLFSDSLSLQKLAAAAVLVRVPVFDEDNKVSGEKLCRVELHTWGMHVSACDRTLESDVHFSDQLLLDLGRASLRVLDRASLQLGLDMSQAPKAAKAMPFTVIAPRAWNTPCSRGIVVQRLSMASDSITLSTMISLYPEIHSGGVDILREVYGDSIPIATEETLGHVTKHGYFYWRKDRRAVMFVSKMTGGVRMIATLDIVGRANSLNLIFSTWDSGSQQCVGSVELVGKGTPLPERAFFGCEHRSDIYVAVAGSIIRIDNVRDDECPSAPRIIYFEGSFGADNPSIHVIA